MEVRKSTHSEKGGVLVLLELEQIVAYETDYSRLHCFIREVLIDEVLVVGSRVFRQFIHTQFDHALRLLLT